MTGSKFDERHLKARVISKLRRDGLIDHETPIASEFRLGSAPARADLALFGRSFIGVEIKSQFDTLRRLHTQLSAYSKRFERSILVVAERHLRALDLGSIDGVELWTVDVQGQIALAREGVTIRRETGFVPLMTLEEQRRFLRGEPARSERDAFAETFRARYGETSARFWKGVKGRRITEADLDLLSRYLEDREKRAERQQDRDARRKRWCSQASELLRVA